VLDNAETILDTETDKSMIARFIEELSAYPKVSLLLTTETTVLPSNASWRFVDVPSLDKDAASRHSIPAYDDENPSDPELLTGSWMRWTITRSQSTCWHLLVLRIVAHS